MPHSSTVLVIDDDLSTQQIVESSLDSLPSVHLITASDGDEGIHKFKQFHPDVVLLDIRLPSYNGIELFRKLKSIDSTVPIIFITGDTSSETTILAIRAGAYDYLAKPLIMSQLRALTQSAIRARSLMDGPIAITAGHEDFAGDRIVSCSKAMIQVYKDIGRVASQNVTVLIRGESGSGKELIARALKQYSDRVDKPFIAVNCAAIPDQLLESELFGHERGAFTGAERRRIGRFEQCNGGTIFLDEVGDMSPLIQGKVLRLLQEQCFERVGGDESIHTNVRILAATNRPLERMVAQRLFREDLLFRLNGFTIHVPSLQERREDIPILLEYYLTRAKQEMGRPDLRGISSDALDLLVRYDWPGNVRQLQSVVRQSMLNSTGAVIDIEHLPVFIRDSESQNVLAWQFDGPTSIDSASVRSEVRGLATSNDSTLAPVVKAYSDHADPLAAFIEKRMAENSSDLYSETLEQMERLLFERVLKETGGNKTQAAKLLGISRAKVRERAAAYTIMDSQPDEDPSA